MRILLLSQDLMASSHVEGVARRLACEAKVYGNQEAILEASITGDILVVDLTASGIDVGQIVTEVRSRGTGATIVAFGPHVHEKNLKRARDAGCDLVVSRGQWDREAVNLCQSFVDESTEN